MDYKARLYDPALGRFIQPDTIIPGMGNPQSFNRYSYVGNSPIRFNDPTGHMQSCGVNGEDECPDHDPAPKSNLKSSLSGKNPKRHGGEHDVENEYVNPNLKIVTQEVMNDIKQIVEKCSNSYYLFQGCKSLQNSTPIEFPLVGIFATKAFWDWKSVDWVDIAINGVGIIGDLGLLSTLAGDSAGPGVWGVSELVEIVGIAKDTLAVNSADFSGISKDALSKFISISLKEKNAPDLIPVFGLAFNISNIANDIGKGWISVPDTTPYHPVTIGPFP